MAKKSKREENYGKYVFRRKRGSRVQIFARVGYYDKNGKWKYKYESAIDEDDAVSKAEKIIKLYKLRGTAAIDGAQMTFEKFADWYKEKYAIEPFYENGQQIGGMRSFHNVRLQLERLKKERFAKMKITSITPEILEQYKNKRKNVDRVKTAAYNRDLELLRAMFNKAVKRGWLEESPFARAENLIRKSLEKRRKVTTTADEEKLVFDFAERSGNKYIYPLVLALRDTGARPSELFPFAAYGEDLDELPVKIKHWMETEVTSDEQVFLPVCWFQLLAVDFRVVPLASLMLRQVEFRFGTMTARLRESLLKLWESTDQNPISLVFPFKEIKRQWTYIRDKMALYTIFKRVGAMITAEDQKAELVRTFGANSPAISLYFDSTGDIYELIESVKKERVLTDDVKLKDLRLRDLRRIWRSKADLAGISEQTAQRILGHKLLETTFHYHEADLELVVEAGRQLDELNLVNDKSN